MIELIGTVVLFGFVGIGMAAVTLAGCLLFEYRVLRRRTRRQS